MAQPVPLRSRSLTYRELWHTPEDGNRYEIICGEVHVTPPPDVSHQRTVRNLQRILDRWVAEHNLGEVLAAPIGVVLGKPSGVQPDLIFVSKGRAAIIRDKAVFGAPDLVIEILSPSTAQRDRGVKREIYESAGVSHYWILDPRKSTLLALRKEEGRYVVEAEAGRAGIFKPRIFPGLSIRLAKIWPR